MSTSDIQKTQQAALHATLWNMANDLRGAMEAYEFKSYILGLIFFRYLSEKVEKQAAEFLQYDNISFEDFWKDADEEIKQSFREEMIDALGYFIAPEHLFSSLIAQIQTNDFDIEVLQKAITSISESSLGTESQQDFEGLFDDMDLTNNKLGKDVKSRSKVMGKAMTSINSLSLEFDNAEIDVLGDAYEYLIGMFAQTAGKKAGEFYTPQQVSKILARIVSMGKSELLSVYDPCCGSGSLLLRVGKECKVRKYYGQELTATTFNLARMNMLLHGVQYKYFNIANGDTLEEPEFYGETFSAVVSNPPYSAKWSANAEFLEDERFSAYGKLAPASKADFAFVAHMLYYLEEEGTLAVVLPHGVLFRGAAEEQIRKVLIKDKNALDAVIGLPANLFYGTSIPTCILVFKKRRNGNSGNILFIDASKDFDKAKNQNLLTDAHIDKIISAYAARTDIEKYSHVATMEEIAANDYNLNIPRYVDTFEEEEPIDLQAEFKALAQLQEEAKAIDEKLAAYFKELGNEVSGVSVPKLRFKGFTDTWEEKCINDCFAKINERNKNKVVDNVISNTARFGLVKQKDYFEKDIAVQENTENYYVIKKGDFVYNPRKSNEAPYGPVRLYELDELGIVSPLYLCFRNKNDIVNSFYNYFFQTSKWHKYVYQNGDTGVRADRVNIKDDTFFALTHFVPQINEQEKIADFLKLFDYKVECETKLLEHMHNVKRALLQQMFV